MALVGADLSNGPNFLAAAWFNRVQFYPPRLMVGLGKEHATNAGIRGHGQFSLCVPSVDQAVVTHWCGIASAKRWEGILDPIITHVEAERRT
jgi:flavin reductase (DIM6/NTAB) family NADH-FMN oxidoreductase RutF